MGVQETNIFKLCQLKAAEFKAVLMRNNRGLFRTMDGERVVQAGLEINGSGDGIGWFPVIITPEMVGKKVAVFLSVETKTEKEFLYIIRNIEMLRNYSGNDDKKKRLKSQLKFADNVTDAGGIGIIAYSPDDVKKALTLYRNSVS